MTPDPSREIEQIIQEARQWLDEHNNQARRYSAKASRIIRELLALLTAASPVSPEVRTEAQLDAAFACHSDRGLDGCADCGRPLNDGEAKCFTVCGGCWVKYIKDLQDKQGGVIR